MVYYFMEEEKSNWGFRIYIILFLVSASLAIIFSALAMSSVGRISNIGMGSMDVSRETMLDIYDRYSKSGVSITGTVSDMELVMVKDGCSYSFNYTVFDLTSNSSSTYMFGENSSRAKLHSISSIVFFDYSGSSPCIVNLSLRIVWREYLYRYLAVPGFIFFAISITLMYKILVARTVEKYYEDRGRK